MIEVIGVKKTFGQQSVLDGVTLTVDHETVGLLGANGAGKTTLFKCILGLLDFNGVIRISGFDVRVAPLEAKKRIAYIPQQFPLWPDMSVSEAMRFIGALREVSEKRQDSLLEEFGLAAHKNKSVAVLSGGMRQKLSITIALLSDPDVLLLDEPTAGLDTWATQEILKILESWKGRKSVLISSHRIEEIQALSHRMVQISGGKLVQPLGAVSSPAPGGDLVCAK